MCSTDKLRRFENKNTELLLENRKLSNLVQRVSESLDRIEKIEGNFLSNFAEIMGCPKGNSAVSEEIRHMRILVNSIY